MIARRTAYLKREAEERDHILQGYLKALDMIDEVIHLIRSSYTVEIARTGLHGSAGRGRCAGRPILAMQLRRLAALERQKILDEHDELMRRIADYADILAKPNASARSSATNSTRSWPATAITAARRSCDSPAK